MNRCASRATSSSVNSDFHLQLSTEVRSITSSTRQRRQCRMVESSRQRQGCLEAFAVLRRLVNAQDKLSELELLQKIIDHIRYLQDELRNGESFLTEDKENYANVGALDRSSSSCTV
uniref:BHLH domain-containing protein n=1 Tax=Syphacia muris TaxID=451379 RepID=A0A0N5AD74_9BILA